MKTNILGSVRQHYHRKSEHCKSKWNIKMRVVIFLISKKTFTVFSFSWTWLVWSVRFFIVSVFLGVQHEYIQMWMPIRSSTNWKWMLYVIPLHSCYNFVSERTCNHSCVTLIRWKMRTARDESASQFWNVSWENI